MKNHIKSVQLKEVVKALFDGKYSSMKDNCRELMNILSILRDVEERKDVDEFIIHLQRIEWRCKIWRQDYEEMKDKMDAEKISYQG